ncbi:S8 family peptidase [Sphingomonas sp. R1]|uniref:S8 family peptidase n=1 Tax=Sphingomonas sp. R1 TaxID=399176 RepID=UPI0022256AC3|nr:S8/S53 family peptidase [Sphingomonas sp. R1]UYY78760.1 S8/S53 family peptidase [Sphingomonas sp. R1]
MLLGMALFAAVAASSPAATPRVAIIDSGVAETPELRGKLIAEYDLGGEGRAAFHPRYDHGTMVATILSRAAAGRVAIVSLRIDDPAGCRPGANPPCQPRGAPIVAAIRKAIALQVDAINISLALADDPAITAAVQDAARAGIVVVLAAGNNGLSHPGNLAMARQGYPNAVLVGALDAAGNVWTGTNRPDPDAQGYVYVWQRGVDVPTALADGRAVTGTGTSFAAPIETARRIAHRRRTA